MIRVFVSVAADADLAKILTQIAEAAGAASAAKYAARFEAVFERLSFFQKPIKLDPN